MEEKAIGIEAIRSLELREMEEEERYLECLKLQRDKIENFKKEVAKKDAMIQDLKDALGQKTDPKPLHDKLAAVANKLKAKDTELAEAKAHSKKTIQEYEQALEELQDLVTKEREEKTRALARYKQKTLDLEEEVTQLKRNNKETNAQLRSLQQKSESQIEELNEQLETCQRQQAKRKELLDSLTHEKTYLETRAKEGAEHAKQLQITRETLEDTQQQAESLRQQVRELEAAAEAREQEVQTQQRTQDQVLRKYKEQVTNLNDELNRAIDLITRQETTIVEIRYRIQEDAAVIAGLKEKAATSETHCQGLETKLMHAQKQASTAERQLSLLETEVHDLRSANALLTQQLKETTDKHQQDALQRKQLAHLRYEKLQLRNEEITRLNELIESLPHE